MNQEDYLKDIYKDFFGGYDFKKEESSNEEEATVEENVDFDNDIDKLFINEESKKLLKKIVNYIYNYTDDKRYLPFNISIVSLTEKTTESIVEILKSACKKSNYLGGTKSYSLSLYKLEEDTFNEVYKDNNIVVLYDLKGLELQSVNDK